MNLDELENRVQIRLDKLDESGQLGIANIESYLKSVLADIKKSSKEVDELKKDLKSYGLFNDKDMGSELSVVIENYLKGPGLISPKDSRILQNIAAKCEQYITQGSINFSRDQSLDIGQKTESIDEFEFLGELPSDVKIIHDLKRSFSNTLFGNISQFSGYRVYKIQKKFNDMSQPKYSVYIFVGKDATMPIRIYINLHGKVYQYLLPSRFIGIGELLFSELSSLFREFGEDTTDQQIREILRKLNLLTDDERFHEKRKNRVIKKDTIRNFREISEDNDELNEILVMFNGKKAKDISSEDADAEFYTADIIHHSGNGRLFIIGSIHSDIIIVTPERAMLLTLNKNPQENIYSIVEIISDSYDGTDNSLLLSQKLESIGFPVIYRASAYINENILDMLPKLTNFSIASGLPQNTAMFRDTSIGGFINKFAPGSAEHKKIESAHAEGKLELFSYYDGINDYLFYIINEGSNKVLIIATINSSYDVYRLQTVVDGKTILEELESIFRDCEFKSSDNTATIKKIVSRLQVLGRIDPTKLEE